MNKAIRRLPVAFHHVVRLLDLRTAAGPFSAELLGLLRRTGSRAGRVLVGHPFHRTPKAGLRSGNQPAGCTRAVFVSVRRELTGSNLLDLIDGVQQVLARPIVACTPSVALVFEFLPRHFGSEADTPGLSAVS